jgi:ABC-type multidrug transport system fused ATPase/permease subunit
MSRTVVITVVLPVFLLPAAVISFVFFCIGRLYLRNALAARKEVAAARSPLFSTLGDSTSGVTTIRAYGRSGAFAARYKRQTDNYNRVRRVLRFYRVPCLFSDCPADATLRRRARQVARVAS